MSRGHGKLQRFLLDVLPVALHSDNRDEPCSITELAAMYYATAHPTLPQRNSVRRAIDRLADEGHVVSYSTRFYRPGRPLWWAKVPGH